jgi:hypothetical protein
MAFGLNKRAVGVFDTRQQAEDALHQLHRSGFPMNKVSIIARDADRDSNIAGVDVQDSSGTKADEGATTGALAGGTLGGITGLLVGLGALAIPGVGPILLAGELGTVLATTLAGGAIGAATGGLVGALIGLGIPEERARVYSDRVSQGGYLVLVDGNDEDIARAQAVLGNSGIQEWGVYNAPDYSTADRSMGAMGTPNYAAGSIGATSYPASSMDTTDYASSSMGATDYTAGAMGIPDYTAGAMPASDYPVGATPAPNYNLSSQDRIADRSGSRQQRAVGVFSERREAEAALNELKNSGFDMERVTVVNRDADRDDRIAGKDVKSRVGNKADEGAVTGAVTGGTVGGIGGLLVGLGALAIPGIGPVMLAGTTATAIATALSGTAIGAAAGGLVGALVGLGIPEERARFYNDRIARGDYLIIVDGTDEEIRQAESILRQRGIEDWDVYNSSESNLVDNPLGGSASERSINVAGTGPEVIVIDHRNQTT